MKSDKFPPTSRYYGIDVATFETAGGKNIAYLRRRFVPSSEQLSLLQEHTVKQGDRLDNITATYLGDPEQFWQVADANNAVALEELTDTIGRKLRITLPAGVPGGEET